MTKRSLLYITIDPNNLEEMSENVRDFDRGIGRVNAKGEILSAIAKWIHDEIRTGTYRIFQGSGSLVVSKLPKKEFHEAKKVMNRLGELIPLTMRKEHKKFRSLMKEGSISPMEGDEIGKINPSELSDIAQWIYDCLRTAMHQYEKNDQCEDKCNEVEVDS